MRHAPMSELEQILDRLLRRANVLEIDETKGKFLRLSS
jgi:hypothetical protein